MTKAEAHWHIHAGRKDWRKGGKPICGVGDQGWCYLAPSIAAFWTRDYYRRCPTCEAHPDVQAQQADIFGVLT
jgi:hypothetical protein